MAKIYPTKDRNPEQNLFYEKPTRNPGLFRANRETYGNPTKISMKIIGIGAKKVKI